MGVCYLVDLAEDNDGRYNSKWTLYAAKRNEQ